MPPTDAQKSFPWLASSRSWSKITFGADGTTTIVDTDGNVVTQNADGTWKVKDDQGGQADVGSKLPDNEFTKLIPKPNFEVSLSYAEGDRCGIQFANLTAEDLWAYAEQLKSAGFTVDAEPPMKNNLALGFCTYIAYNSDGIKVELSGVAGISSIVTSAWSSEGKNSRDSISL